ncbi:MAG: peptidoglycan DD-metalloendopeptidase family protein [Maritimibacter sp.]
MSFDIDPKFKQSGKRSKRRHRKRLAIRLGIGAGSLLAIFAVFWLVSGLFSGKDTLAEAEGDDAFGTFEMVQSETGEADAAKAVDYTASFIDLARDPMILRLAQADVLAVKHIPGPAGFVPDRAGAFGPERIAVLQDKLFVGEKRLITTLPSSRDDFALFQAQRTAAITDLEAQPVRLTEANEGELVTIEEESSWGDFIASDGDSAHGEEAEEASEEGAAVYVETEIENTTSTALALRESQRFALYEDIIVVLSAERALSEVLTANAFDEAEAAQITKAAARNIELPEKLPKGSIVALRMRPGVEGKTLMQMSLYGPEGYLASLAQVGRGRFEAAADPWLQENLLTRSGDLRQQAMASQDVRLLDALYSAAIRNGLPTNLVGEMIVIMSKQFDLDRFVTDGDTVTMLFAREPGAAGNGLGRMLYVGINGPSGDMDCYVIEASDGAGFSCFDFENGGSVSAGAGNLGGGLLVPVQGVKTSGFGPRHHPILKQVRNHNGVDWAAPTGTPIHAVGAGRVKLAGNGGGYGNVVYIDHGNGVESRYAHMSKFGEGIRNGVPVAAGQVIGFVGTTGRSTGPHLHFELRVSGAPVNPLTFAGAIGGGAQVASSTGAGSGAVQALVNQIIKVESGGNATAKNSRSTATGLGQFIESTWLRMMRDYRPDLARTMSRQELLNLRTDPALSREMVTNLARENESFLRARGHQITPGRLYLAHFLGPSGANVALNANANATVLEVMGSGVVNANPFLRGKSIADLRAWSDRKMSGAKAGAYVASAPSVRIISPEIKKYRETVDGILKEL